MFSAAIEPLFKPLTAIIGLVVLVSLMIKSSKRRNTLPLPPGPPAEPFLGHLRVVPKENTAAAFAKWADELKSDVIHFKSLGQSVVVLNSRQAAQDLLGKRGSNYCDRPRFTLLEVMGWGRTISFMPYGKLWKMHRKLLQTSFSNSNVGKWQELQTLEARRSVGDLLKRPDRWEDSLRRFAVAIVLKVSYGVDVTDDQDPYVGIASDAMYATGNGGTPGNSLIDFFPIARYLPNFLAPDWALKFARDWRGAIEKLHNVPFAEAVDAIANNHDNESLAHSLLKQHREEDEENQLGQSWSLEDIKGAAGAVFIAGADTTWATCTIFVLNMVRHPEIQVKAQYLLDSVVGRDRLPEFSDRAKLPYINFIVQELYRWSPLAPLGIPHKSIDDDTYNGMFIPGGKADSDTSKHRNMLTLHQGKTEARTDWGNVPAKTGRSIVYPNVQAMSRDPYVYRDAHLFNPDRYDSVNNGGFGELPPVGHFGFGRRICVGRHLADNSVWMMVATMLALLNFQKPSASTQDEREDSDTPEFTNGGTCHPQHFRCLIQPRYPLGQATTQRQAM